ncbi:hypothetical protein BGT96224_1521 [Blumeria graminis f. sp. tritici 96224]|uniref:Uncharacterized protein n=2 Tax=Blumeria graminis f. sp. tritici 96224 TaxID=1268274 RepID=A0A656KPC9_BLUGR|nr:hypothetical protein BGT96224_1521 [Blumeria graminis f. sp. tritici 96224]
MEPNCQPIIRNNSLLTALSFLRQYNVSSSRSITSDWCELGSNLLCVKQLMCIRQRRIQGSGSMRMEVLVI